MKQYGYVRALYSSFYSKDLYRDVAQHWGLSVLLYLLLVLGICWFVVSLLMQLSFSLWVTKAADTFGKQMPSVIHFTNGVASTPENRPYVVRSPDNKEVWAVFDTSGKYTTPKQAQTSWLLTKDKVIYLVDPNSMRVYTYGKINQVADLQKIKSYIVAFSNWAWVLFFPIFLLGSFIYHLLQSVIYAVLGKVFTLLLRVHLPYHDILKLTIVSLTPSIFLGLICDLLISNQFKYLWVLYFIVSMSYLLFAIRANKS